MSWLDLKGFCISVKVSKGRESRREFRTKL